jgi:hypothetical protein
MFLLVLVDDSCSRVSSCITTWLVRVLSRYLCLLMVFKLMLYLMVDKLYDILSSLDNFS